MESADAGDDGLPVGLVFGEMWTKKCIIFHSAHFMHSFDAHTPQQTSL